MVLAKKTKGRQKIDIKKMENESNLQVTFSKRRAGLFKKASELCTLTGSEVALVVFSPGEKVYSFGSPSVNAIIERFESQAPPQMDPIDILLEAHRRANVQDLNKEFTVLENKFDVEKKRGEFLHQLRNIGQSRNWWKAPFHELNLEQLAQLHLALEELQRNAKIEVQMLLTEAAKNNPSFEGINRFGVGSYPFNSVGFGNALFESKSSPTSAFSPYVASPSSVDTSIFVKNDSPFGAGANASSSSFLVRNDPNASGLGDGAGIPPQPHGFNSGYGGGGVGGGPGGFF